jgi:hypothetical protein
MSLKKPKLGFQIETQGTATTLTIPDRYPLVALYLWFLDCVLIYMAFGHGQDDMRGPDFELPAVVVYGGIVALTILIGLCLRNTIKVTRTPQTLVLTRFHLGFPRRTQFSFADVRNLRVYGPLRNNRKSRKFRVLLDYGDETITLAQGMTQPMATLIVEKLMVYSASSVRC